MSYLVLARKWRPKRFAELVGQEHVVRALTNALDAGRVHHAFLFTGTRGVGKTTIARIFAKSLNCERGQGAEPCGECPVCLDVDAGRFVDLLEIDAASNTGVDDVRELIENAQYLPARGRVKVYLVDEVHMLSRNAFNALLKTLEEPPPHVKFLLATTDPQKLPVTVLSRCLQFNLKRLEDLQIRGQMEKILAAEGLPSEPGAIALLAKGADGSLRDGLSLLDQAIAYTAGRLDEAGVRTMLGSVDQARVGELLAALAAGDGAALMAEVEVLAGFSPDWGAVLEAIAAALHGTQLRQLVPGAQPAGLPDQVEDVARAVSPELVQLWYQMATQGRRDLPWAPTPRSGFEMALLRMLAFRPAGVGAAPSAPAGPGAGGAGGAGPGPGGSGGPPPRKAPPSPFDPPGGGRQVGPAAPSPRASAPPAVAAAPVPAVAAPAPPPRGASPFADASPFAAEAAALREAAPAPAPIPSRGPMPAALAPAAGPASAPRLPEPAEPIRAPQRTETPRFEAPRSDAVRSDAVRPAAADEDLPWHVPGEATPPSTSPSHAQAGMGAPPAAPSHAHAEPGTGPAHPLRGAEDWLDLLAGLGLRGPLRELAANAAFGGWSGGVLRLSLPEAMDYLRTESLQRALSQALAPALGVAPTLKFEAPGAIAAGTPTLAERDQRARDDRQAGAEAAFMAHPAVIRLIQEHGAIPVPGSIRPLEEH